MRRYLVQPPLLLKQFASKAIWRMDSAQKKIYLTFDDGPIPTVTSMVLEILKKYNIKATFFCVGDNIVKHPAIFQEILSEKHAVGNHTFHHLDGWKTDTRLYLENIERCQQAMDKEKPTPHNSLFRPPYGKAKKSQVRRISQVLSPNYTMVMWDVLSGDYDANTSPEKCLKNVSKYVRNGSIIVFHDNIKAKKNVEYALPRFIEFALKEGYAFEKLA